MQLKNTGQVTLTAVHALTDAPLSTDCSTTATLAPGAVTSCVLTATAVQDDYDAGTLQLVVNATSGHMGSATHVLSGTLSYSSSISLNDSASMDVAVVATPSGVNIAGVCVQCNHVKGSLAAEVTITSSSALTQIHLTVLLLPNTPYCFFAAAATQQVLSSPMQSPQATPARCASRTQC